MPGLSGVQTPGGGGREGRKRVQGIQRKQEAKGRRQVEPTVGRGNKKPEEQPA